ncbi:MBL fold metallo-hydrolase [Rhizorhabdus wittichii DC-6]|nr:MBL fold metallo-hydrolase [Rhizorhabdus wittichii DC-6]
MAIDIQFHGAARTVTGSCTEVIAGKTRLLVDCGLFQGPRSLEHLNHQPFAFDVRTIDAVLLSHAHIDHSGLLPRLAAEGYNGPIWMTAPTRDLIAYLLADAARIQVSDARHHNLRRDRVDSRRHDPLYTPIDAERACDLARTADLDSWFEPCDGVRARFWDAGHILGAASIEIEAGGVSLLFSGDLGGKIASLEAAPRGPSAVDHVICESTYGDRARPATDLGQRRQALKAVIEGAMAAGGNLIIPVFAVERTQELLLDMATLFDSGELAARSVFIDSPLATRITSVFANNDIDGTDDGAVFSHSAFHFTEDSMESMRLNAMSGAIILAGSGMCEGGRVRHHLIHNLARPDSTVLFVGYQAHGTLGRLIAEGADRVRISGHDIAVRAQIRSIDTYSAHADRDDLLAWIEARRPIKGSLFLNHGEAGAIDALAAACAGKADVRCPSLGERFHLLAGEPARRTKTGDPMLQAAVERDWQNDYADFSLRLKSRLEAIIDPADRRRAIADMRRALAAYQAAPARPSKHRHQHRA